MRQRMHPKNGVVKTFVNIRLICANKSCDEQYTIPDI